MIFGGLSSDMEAKNLKIIADQLEAEALAARKSELYAEQFADPALKSCAQQLANHHKENFMSLLSYLDSHR